MAPKEGTGVGEDPAPERRQAPAVRRGPLRLSACQLMLFGATVIIGAAALPLSVPLPRLFGALVVWHVGYLSLFIPPL